MIAKFNLYDFIANLVPGLVFLWCFDWMIASVGLRLPLDFAGGLAETSIIVAVGYVAGLMLQAFSERFVQQKFLLPRWGGFPSARWLLAEDTRLSTSYKERVLALIQERFGVATEPEIPEGVSDEEKRKQRLAKNQELFFLCYNHVDNLSPRPLNFTTQYGLFRCLMTVFGLLSVMSILLGFVRLLDDPVRIVPFLMLAAFYAVLCWLSYIRCQRRGEDFARTVYDLFVGGAAAKP